MFSCVCNTLPVSDGLAYFYDFPFKAFLSLHPLLLKHPCPFSEPLHAILAMLGQ